MRLGTTKASDVTSAIRLDCKFFLDEGQVAFLRVSSGRWPMVTAGDVFGKNNIWMPGRFSRVIAATEEYGKPLLVPYDCFRYLPYSREYLSKSQVNEYERTEVQRGWLLLVRSGRNLGPVAMVDAFLKGFTVSDDMIRISLPATEDLLYFCGLMNTNTGQAIIRRDRNGSVIDHLGPKQVAALRYPVVEPALKEFCIDAMRRALNLREKARLVLENVASEFLKVTGLAPEDIILKPADKVRRFEIRRSEIADRLDCEPFAPLYAAYRKRIAGYPSHRPIGELATVFKPAGRYKTNYVTSEEFGLKLLSGRQIAQFKPIAMKIMSPKAWDSPDEYLLKKDMVLLTSDGRAAENLADCVLVRDDRVDWTASGHVHRLTGKPGIHPGLLYLACACRPVQELLKALATGSVVDALSESDVASVVVPYPQNSQANRLGDAAVKAWDLFAEARGEELKAVDALEAEFASGDIEMQGVKTASRPPHDRPRLGLSKGPAAGE